VKAFCDGWLVGKRTSKVTSKSSNRAAGQQKQQGKSSTPQSRGSTGKERGLTRTPADWTVRGKGWGRRRRCASRRTLERVRTFQSPSYGLPTFQSHRSAD